MIVDGPGLRSILNTGVVPESVDVLYACTLVFDPQEELFGPMASLSSVGRSIASGLRHRVGMPDAADALTLARRLLADGKLNIVDPTDEEILAAKQVAADAKLHRPLGIATAAAVTIAIARERSMTVGTADLDVEQYLTAAGVAVVVL